MQKFFENNPLISILFLFIICSSSSFATQQAKDGTQSILRILFLSNLNGNIENCQCGNPSLGGLDYMHSIIADKRDDEIKTIWIDGGDFCNHYSYPQLNQTVLDIYSLMRPDIIVPAEQEFHNSHKFSDKLVKMFSGNILASNWKFGDINVNPSVEFTLNNSRRVVILSYLQPDLIDPKKVPQLQFKDDKMISEYNKYASFDSASLILIYHGMESELKNIIAAYPEFDLILHGHDQSYGLDMDSKPINIGGGSDGEHLIEVLIDFTDAEIKYNVNSISVTQDLPVSSEVRKVIDLFNESVTHKGVYK